MWLGVLTVSVGIFSMIPAEQLPVGLIPAIADELAVSTGTAGQTVTAPGIIAAIAQKPPMVIPTNTRDAISTP
jgi:predicted MFS family arabinose efflux permease